MIAAGRQPMPYVNVGVRLRVKDYVVYPCVNTHGKSLRVFAKRNLDLRLPPAELGSKIGVIVVRM